jgi:hypothetical protein
MDPVLQAFTGLMVDNEGEDGIPHRVPFVIGDVSTAPLRVVYRPFWDGGTPFSLDVRVIFAAPPAVQTCHSLE